MKNDFEKRVQENVNKEVLEKCSAFDPRFKTLKSVCGKTDRDRVWENIAEEALSRVSQDSSC